MIWWDLCRRAVIMLAGLLTWKATISYVVRRMWVIIALFVIIKAPNRSGVWKVIRLESVEVLCFFTPHTVASAVNRPLSLISGWVSCWSIWSLRVKDAWLRVKPAFFELVTPGQVRDQWERLRWTPCSLLCMSLWQGIFIQGQGVILLVASLKCHRARPGVYRRTSRRGWCWWNRIWGCMRSSRWSTTRGGCPALGPVYFLE